MNKTLPIQNACCSNQDYLKICSIDTEIIDAPTSPLIHQMSRFWLINEGHGIFKLQDREYKLQPGALVSVLPWQISEVIQVDAPLQYYLLAYCFDRINDTIKSVCYGDGKPVNLIEKLEETPVVYCDEEEYASGRSGLEGVQLSLF